MEIIAPNAIVLQAGCYEFRNGGEVSFPCIYSRRFLACLSGGGKVSVNGNTYPIKEGDFLFLPWKHSLNCVANKDDPFRILGCHIVPDLKPNDGKILYRIPHFSDDELAQDAFRKDAVLLGLEGIVRGRFLRGTPLYYLCNHIVQWYLERPHREEDARARAQLLLAELAFTVKEQKKESTLSIPPALRNILIYVRDHMDEKLMICDMARLAKCSPSSVTRLFRKHLDQSPTQWLLKTKIERASQTLIATSLRISEIGRRVGFEDPYYFSKAFKKTTGMSAREYRRRNIGF